MTKEQIQSFISQAKQNGQSDMQIYDALKRHPSAKQNFASATQKGFSDERIAMGLGLNISKPKTQSNTQPKSKTKNDDVKHEQPSFLADAGRTFHDYYAGARQGVHYVGDGIQGLSNKLFGTNFKTDDYEDYTAQVKEEHELFDNARRESGKGFNWGGLAVDVGAGLIGGAGVGALAKTVGLGAKVQNAGSVGKKAHSLITGNTYKGAAVRGVTGGAMMEGAKFAENAEQRTNNAINGGIGGAVGGVIGHGITNGTARVVNAKNKNLRGSASELVELGDKHGVRVSAGDAGRGAFVSRAETQMERVPVVGMQGFRESQQQEAKNAAQKVVNSLKDNLSEAEYKALPQLKAAAERGEPNAKRIMRLVNEAGDDHTKVLQVSAEIQGWRGTQLANQMYSRVARLAGDDVIAPNKTIQAIDNVLAEQPKRMPNEELVRELSKIRANLTSEDPNLGNVNFKEMRAIQSRLGELVDEWGRAGKSTSGFSAIRSAINEDLENFAQQSGKQNLMQELKRANLFYQDMVKRKDRSLVQAMKSNKPDELFDQFVKAGKADRAENFYRSLDNKGQSALRYAMAENALNKAINPSTGIFSPAKFALEFERLREPYAQIFHGFAKAEMDGFVKLMRHVERAGQYLENPANGQRWIDFAMLGGAVIEPTTAVKGAVVSAMAKILFTTDIGKHILLAAKELPPDSPKLANLLKQAEKLATISGSSMAND